VELIIALLMIVGFLFLFLEIFVPGLVIGIIGAMMLIGGIVLSFMELGPEYGGLMLLGTVIVSAIIAIVGVKIFPHTAIGKRIILKTETSREDGYSASSDKLAEFTDAVGVATCHLRPTGVADFGGKRMDVVTEGGFVEKGTKVKVIHIDGNRIVVQREA